MSASCAASGSRVDRAVAVDQHPVGEAHEEDAGGDRRPPARVLMISNAGRIVAAVVWVAPETMPSAQPGWPPSACRSS